MLNLMRFCKHIHKNNKICNTTKIESLVLIDEVSPFTVNILISCRLMKSHLFQ